MSDLSPLGRRIAEAQDLAAAAAADATAIARRRLQLPRRRTVSTRFVMVGGTASVVLLVAALRVLTATSPLEWHADSAGPGGWVRAASEPNTVTFSDGTAVVVAPDAALRVAQLDEHGAALVVESGRVEARVVKRPGARWSVQAGPYEILVIGTAFSVAWTPTSQSLEVVVTEGRVAVNGPGARQATLSAGERLASDRVGTWDVLSTSPPAQRLPAEPPTRKAEGVPVPDVTAPVSSMPARRSAPSLPAPSRWRALAEAGEALAALEAAEREGLDRILATSQADDLLALADAARLGKQPARARQALLVLRQRFPSTPTASAAAFRLGRLSSETDAAEAARWFGTCADEAPEGPLVREARGRQIEALMTVSPVAASAVARAYLARWPDGPSAALARRVAAGP